MKLNIFNDKLYIKKYIHPLTKRKKKINLRIEHKLSNFRISIFQKWLKRTKREKRMKK